MQFRIFGFCKISKTSNLKATPTDQGWAWMIMLVSFVLQLFIDGTISGFGVYFVAMQQDEAFMQLNYSRTSLALPGSLQPGFFLCMGAFGGPLIQVLGFRWAGSLGSLLAAGGMAIASLQTNLHVFNLFYGVLSGSGFGLLMICAIVSINYYFDRFRGVVSGIAMSGAGVGCLAVPPLLTWMISILGWRHCILVYSAGLGVLSLLFVLQLRPFISPTLEGKQEGTLSDENFLTDLNQAVETNSKCILHNIPIPENNAVVLGKSKPDLETIDTTSNPWKQIDPLQNGDGSSSSSGCVISHELDPEKNMRFVSLPPCIDNALSIQTKQERNKILQCNTESTVSERLNTASNHKDDEKLVNFISKFIRVGQKVISVFNLHLFRDPMYLFLILIGVTNQLAYFIPYVYLIDYALSQGIGNDDAVLLVVILSSLHTIGRIVTGIMANLSWVDTVYLSGIGSLVAGLFHAVLPLFLPPTFAWYAFYAACFGFVSAAPMPNIPLLLVRFLGVKLLAAGFSNLNLVKGVASFIGPMLAVTIVEKTGNPGNYFIVASVCMILSAIAHLGLTRLPGTSCLASSKIRKDDITSDLRAKCCFGSSNVEIFDGKNDEILGNGC